MVRLPELQCAKFSALTQCLFLNELGGLDVCVRLEFKRPCGPMLLGQPHNCSDVLAWGHRLCSYSSAPRNSGSSTILPRSENKVKSIFRGNVNSFRIQSSQELDLLFSCRNYYDLALLLDSTILVSEGLWSNPRELAKILA